jgi:hypothetical protein
MTLSLLPAALRIAERNGAKVPDGLTWGLRSIHPDFTSSRGFRWPFPGKWAVASGPFTKSSDPCPSLPGDGLCAGLSWYGIASGGISSNVVLLVGWRASAVLGESEDKIRAKRVYVAEIITFAALLAERSNDEDLNLYGADLYGANLRGANLRGADLYGADLYGANLRGANLRGADLQGANLQGADLRGANLQGANLHRANLWGANLHRADLRGANLQRANLQRANLQRADLQRANLQDAIGYTP